MSAVQRYAPSVLSFLVLVLGGVQAAVAVGLSPVAIGQLVVLALTTATTWLVPLVGGRWRGKVKTGLELLGVAITLALPFIATGTITWADGLLVAVAFIKALGAELGVQIRLDKPAPLPVQQVGDVHVVTSLPSADVTAPSRRSVTIPVTQTVTLPDGFAGHAHIDSAGVVTGELHVSGPDVITGPMHVDGVGHISRGSFRVATPNEDDEPKHRAD